LSRWTRAGWFLAYYAAGVAALGVVALAIRAAL
jgi:hypothetical protein